MKRFLSHLHLHRLLPPPLLPPPPLPILLRPNSPSLPFQSQFLRLSSSSSSSSVSSPLVEDVSNKELKRRLEEYFKVDEELEMPSVAEAVLRRKLADTHPETDDELIEELRNKPFPEVQDRDIQDDFEELYSTDEELDNICDAKTYVQEKMMKDEFFNMDEKKWDEMIKEATEAGYLKDTKECEGILEDMLNWDKLLPDEIKKKVAAKLDELSEIVEQGEMEPEQAYELYKEFEDKVVSECQELIGAEQPPEEDAIPVSGKDIELEDPPGTGPILRWQSRIVFVPGGDSWHPKNRKVKLSVTVKELELSRHAFRRLCEVVGKRYHPGKDELTITSDRFEHREENRKDCLRTLYATIEDAMKADKLVEEARNAFVKDRLKANPQFMDRLKKKAMEIREYQAIAA